MRPQLRVSEDSDLATRQWAAFHNLLPMYGAVLLLVVLGLQFAVRQLMPADESMADLTRRPSSADQPTIVYKTNLIGANGRYGHPATTTTRLERFGA